MATKSMLKNVDIKEKYLGRNLVEALERAATVKKTRKTTSNGCEEIPREKLKEFFG